MVETSLLRSLRSEELPEMKAIDTRNDLHVVPVAGGKEEWRHITFPAGGIAGAKHEVTYEGKRAVVLLPEEVKEGEKFTIVVDPTEDPRHDPALYDDRYRKALTDDGMHVVTLPDGREEWRNITCPDTHGVAMEVFFGEKRAVVTIPVGLKPGEKFNAFAGFTCTKYSAADLQVKTLPDGTEEWRNIPVPPGAYVGQEIEVRQDGKRSFVEVPAGVKEGGWFNAIATVTNLMAEDVAGFATIDKTVPPMEVVALPDGREEWRNIFVPVGGYPGAIVECTMDHTDQRALVKVPDGMKEGDLFNAIALPPQSAIDSRKAPSKPRPAVDDRKTHSTLPPQPATDNRKVVKKHGPETATRLRLQRKLEQRRQARQPRTATPTQDNAAKEADRSGVVSRIPDGLSKMEQMKWMRENNGAGAAGTDSATSGASDNVLPSDRPPPATPSEMKAAAKRAKRKRQKERKRAEAAAAAARPAALPDIEEVATSPLPDPVPEIEEAPELDYDPKTEGIPG